MVRNTVIVRTGRYEPPNVVPNSAFEDHEFYLKDGTPERKSSKKIVKKFQERTGIESRLIANPDQVASDLGTQAFVHALDDMDLGQITKIIGASNFGDVMPPNYDMQMLPNLATRMYHKAARQLDFNTEGHRVDMEDIVKGCPGWLAGLILADAYYAQGETGLTAVAGMETLSKVSDPHDKDSMIYSDGGGIVIVDSIESAVREGVLSVASRTISYMTPASGSPYQETDPSEYIRMGPSNKPGFAPGREFLKLLGPNVATLATTYVPQLINEALVKAGVELKDVKLLALHQANMKMDYDMALASGVPEDMLEAMVPITLHEWGNASLATIPMMLDKIFRGEMQSRNGHKYDVNPGDIIVMAAVGGSVHANALVYKVPEHVPYN